ncbi:nucleotidyltransferase family protein [Sinorhizobium fredii]|uniref:nucleotidyltransferase family protein n=1 Tax=Rhizobium fredii TaxID=380 RepID=UPI0004ADFD50|nr:nucleotidyltransferase family protein [Sinorhizobium fredii]
MSLSTKGVSPLKLYPAEPSFVSSESTVIDAIKVIDAAAMQIALYVDGDKRLVGVVTDGDIRRAILRGTQLHDPVSQVLNYQPLVAREGMSMHELAQLICGKSRILRLPVVDGAGKVVGLYRAEEIAPQAAGEWPVILMAGGLGSRLRPYTDSMPKPMLEVGGRPILEQIILQFKSHGFHRFYLSVNYMAEVIKSHFGDGSNLGVEVSYLEEVERMGTAGSLRLLPTEPDSPFFVMNGDLLTTTDFSMLMQYHLDCGAEATMCLREYTVEVPYGVIQHEEGRLTGFQEKPKHQHFVNAGIYVLNPSVLSHVPAEGYFDMPSLFDKLMAEDPAGATVYPLREYWCDIGRIEDLERARNDVAKIIARRPPLSPAA